MERENTIKTDEDKMCKSNIKLYLVIPIFLVLMVLSFILGYYVSQNIEVEQSNDEETNIDLEDEDIVVEEDTEEETTPDEPVVQDIYTQLRDITEWDIEDDILDWSVVNLNSTVLDDVECSSIVLLSKTYNGTVLSGSNVDEQLEELRLEQSALEDDIKKLIIENGWNYAVSPTSNDWVSNYLYSKDNLYILLQVGTKDAVLGGMYINVEYCD